MHKLDFVFVHQFGAALIDHAGQIGHKNIAFGHAHFDEQSKTSKRGSTCAGCDQFDFFQVLARHLDAIQNRSAHHNRGAVLVIMKNWNLHALAQFALDIKTVGGFDIF